MRIEHKGRVVSTRARTAAGSTCHFFLKVLGRVFPSVAEMIDACDVGQVGRNSIAFVSACPTAVSPQDSKNYSFAMMNPLK